MLRPDGQWALLIVNKDQDNEHAVTVRFDDPIRGRSGGFFGPVESIVFGKAEYQWHPAEDGGHADPDGPAKQTTLQAQPGTIYHRVAGRP